MSKPPPLEAVRARIDEVDAALLRLIDERAALAVAVAEAKRVSGEGEGFALRPAREAQVLRRLLASPRTAASPQHLVYLWRQIMADSLARQGPFHLAVWGGRDPGRMVELARERFSATPPLKLVADAQEALTAAKTPGGVAVLPLGPDSAWWGRLLAEPQLRVFASLPELVAWGPAGALAVAAVEVEPSGADETFWVTDAPGPAGPIETELGQGGLAGSLLAQSGGLKLFSLGGYVQPQDERLARAPGRLKGVIGAASLPLDV
jgi:chorismate mutase